MVGEGRETMGYEHGYDAEVFYLGLALDQQYIEGYVCKDPGIRSERSATQRP